MIRPTFAIVGAQKAATTWLFECLNAHPEVFVPDAKELHYFCPTDLCRFSRRREGAEWYAGQFADDRYMACGDLTTDYMFYPGVAAELHRHNPEMKIIFMLRDPVDRAYSGYWMWRRHKSNLPPFREMLDREPSYVERGLYYRQIEPYLERFGWERLRIYIYEEVMADKSSAVADLYEFIGVDPTYCPAALEQNVGGSHRFPPTVAFLVYKVISPIINTPVVLPLWRRVRSCTDASTRLRRWFGSNDGGRGYPPMDPGDRAYLAELFRAENRRLFELLGRDVPGWEH